MKITELIAKKSTTRCRICNTACQQLSRHMSSVHVQRIKCVFCNKPIKIIGRIDLLRQHLTRCKKYTFESNHNVKLVYDLMMNKFCI